MTATNHWATCDSSLGMLTLSAGERGLNRLSFAGSLPAGGAPRLAEGKRPHELDRDAPPAILTEAIEQLGEYFAEGGRRSGQTHPGPDRDPVPSRRRHGQQADWLSRRPEAQASAA